MGAAIGGLLGGGGAAAAGGGAAAGGAGGAASAGGAGAASAASGGSALKVTSKLVGAGFEIAGSLIEGEAAAQDAITQARLTMVAARQRDQDAREAANQQASTNVVRTAKSGVKMSGSALEVMVENKKDFERDRVRNMRAARTTSKIFRAQAANARRAGRLGAVKTGVMTGLSLAGM